MNMIIRFGYVVFGNIPSSRAHFRTSKSDRKHAMNIYDRWRI